jgi:DNA transformation protein and related proteins
MTNKIYNNLADMRNLGEKTQRYLQEVGINTPQDLQDIGAIEAWYRLKFMFGKQVNLIFLYALQGALMDCDCFKLPTDIKNHLKEIARNYKS